MKKGKNIKIFGGLFYLMTVTFLLYLLFSKFSLQEITSYEFIKNNRNYFYELKNSNLFQLAILFILFSIIWVLCAGFGSPLAIFSGFIFGKWLGIFVVVLGMSIGATGLYVFANYFLKDFIKSKFLKRYRNLKGKFKKSEFFYLLIYRFVGGIPFAISNVLPCMFNVKISNLFWATMIGMTPQLFLVVSIGSGLDKIIDQNSEPPRIKDLLFMPDIYIPLFSFFTLLIITVFVRRKFYKK